LFVAAFVSKNQPHLGHLSTGQTPLMIFVVHPLLPTLLKQKPECRTLFHPHHSRAANIEGVLGAAALSPKVNWASLAAGGQTQALLGVLVKIPPCCPQAEKWEKARIPTKNAQQKLSQRHPEISGYQ